MLLCGVNEYGRLSAVCWPAVHSLSGLLAACPWGENDKITPKISVAPADDSSSLRLRTCTSTHALQSQNGTSTHIPNSRVNTLFINIDIVTWISCGYFLNRKCVCWQLRSRLNRRQVKLNINFLSFALCHLEHLLSSSLPLTFTLHRSPQTVLPDSEQARNHSALTQMKLTPICIWQIKFTSLTINHARPTVYSGHTLISGVIII